MQFSFAVADIDRRDHIIYERIRLPCRNQAGGAND